MYVSAIQQRKFPIHGLAGEMRQAYLEKAETQKLKSKARERMQPKMGKLDIDYQVCWGKVVMWATEIPWLVAGLLISPPPFKEGMPLFPCHSFLQVLHDAFFKYQNKPRLSKLGELYYEGKEFEADIKHATPGMCSMVWNLDVVQGKSACTPRLVLPGSLPHSSSSWISVILCCHANHTAVGPQTNRRPV